MSNGGALVWCPFGCEEDARAASKALLDEGLIACANIIPGIISIYEWNGERGEGREVGVLFKTHAAKVPLMTQRLAQLHSCDTPAIMHWDASAHPAATLDWLEGLNTGGLGVGRD